MIAVAFAAPLAVEPLIVYVSVSEAFGAGTFPWLVVLLFGAKVARPAPVIDVEGRNTPT